MSESDLGKFVLLLRHSPGGAVFNPWWQHDRANDAAPDAAEIRRAQLRAYLRCRVRSARVAIIGEALGYRGGHFTGIPMTSERILLGRNSIIAATLCDRRTQTVGHRLPLQIIPMAPKQTSKRTLCRDGFSEPTATIVWAALLNAGLNPEQFVLWNAFPWHSFDPHSGMLSNRMPKKSECACGVVILKRFVELFSLQRFVALGRVAHEQLRAIGIEAQYVRHPASGGAKLFRQQIGQIVAAN